MAPKAVQGSIPPAAEEARLTYSVPGYICNCLLLASMKIEDKRINRFCFRVLSVSRNYSRYIDRVESRVKKWPACDNRRQINKWESSQVSLPCSFGIVLCIFRTCDICNREFHQPFLHSHSKPFFVLSRNTFPYWWIEALRDYHVTNVM